MNTGGTWHLPPLHYQTMDPTKIQCDIFFLSTSIIKVDNATRNSLVDGSIAVDDVCGSDKEAHDSIRANTKDN
jgi:hypothetical protein